MKIKNHKIVAIFAGISAIVGLGVAGYSGVIINQKGANGQGGATPAFISTTNPYVRVTNMTEYPHGSAVRLFMNDGTSDYYCSGRIISSNIVLTAAHCLTSDSGVDRSVRIRVPKAGQTDLIVKTDTVSPSRFEFYNKSEYVKWASDSTKDAKNPYDIAYMIFDKPLQLGAITAKPVTIANSEPNMPDGTRVSYTGFPSRSSEPYRDSKDETYSTNVTPGYMYKVEGPIVTYLADSQVYAYDLSVVGGSSGSGVVGPDGKIVGVNIAEVSNRKSDGFGMGFMAPLRGAAYTKTKDVVSKNSLTGWYSDAGNRYYIDPDSKAFVTGEKTIEGRSYRFSATTGAMEADLGAVLRGTVKVRHINEDNQEVAPTETIVNNQTYGTQFTAQPKVIANYNAGVLVSGSDKGTVDSPELILTYRYTYKRGNVTVRGVDENGAELYSEKLLTNAKYGTQFNSQIKVVENHTANPGQNISGTLSQDNVVVTISYVHNRGTVKVKYIDQDGRTLKEEVIAENAKYGEVVKIKPQQFEGYELVNEDAETEITVSKDETLVEIKYAKIIIPSAPQTPNPIEVDNKDNKTTTLSGNGSNLSGSSEISNKNISTVDIQTPNTGFENTPIAIYSILISVISILTFGVVKISKKG